MCKKYFPAGIMVKINTVWFGNENIIYISVLELNHVSICNMKNSKRVTYFQSISDKIVLIIYTPKITGNTFYSLLLKSKHVFSHTKPALTRFAQLTQINKSSLTNLKKLHSFGEFCDQAWPPAIIISIFYQTFEILNISILHEPRSPKKNFAAPLVVNPPGMNPSFRCTIEIPTSAGPSSQRCVSQH